MNSSRRFSLPGLRLPLSSLLACSLLALAPAALSAAEAGTAEKSAQPASALEEKMEAMSAPFRRLNKLAADPTKYAEALEQLAKFREVAGTVREMTPALAAEKPEAERAAFIAAYQKGIDAMLAKAAELEAALKAGDAAAVKAQLDALRGMQRSGHKEFKKPEKKSGT